MHPVLASITKLVVGAGSIHIFFYWSKLEGLDPSILSSPCLLAGLETGTDSLARRRTHALRSVLRTVFIGIWKERIRKRTIEPVRGRYQIVLVPDSRSRFLKWQRMFPLILWPKRGDLMSVAVLVTFDGWIEHRATHGPRRSTQANDHTHAYRASDIAS